MSQIELSSPGLTASASSGLMEFMMSKSSAQEIVFVQTSIKM